MWTGAENGSKLLFWFLLLIINQGNKMVKIVFLNVVNDWMSDDTESQKIDSNCCFHTTVVGSYQCVYIKTKILMLQKLSFVLNQL